MDDRDVEGGVRPLVIETERLLLRRWKSADREPFARLNADPRIPADPPRGRDALVTAGETPALRAIRRLVIFL